MIKSGADICNEITSYEALHEPSLNTKEYTDLVGEGYYLSSDVDLRIKKIKELFSPINEYGGRGPFFTREQALKFIVFCFGDMNEDFKTKIEKLEEKKI